MNPERFNLLIDSSGFYGFSNRTDPYYPAARAQLINLGQTGGRACTTNFIVAESHALFLARRGRHAALRFLDEIGRSGIHVVRITTDDEEAAVAILRRYDDKDFSYTDATSFAVMQRLGVQVALTSDRHFVQFGFEAAGLS